MNHVQWPDIVANLRVDQAWGSAQIMGAVHRGRLPATTEQPLTRLHSINGGHPNDKIGFAVGAGIKINFPMIGPGDYFQAQVNYTQGASALRRPHPGAARLAPGIFGAGRDELGVGFFADGVYCGSNATGGRHGAPARPVPQAST